MVKTQTESWALAPFPLVQPLHRSGFTRATGVGPLLQGKGLEAEMRTPWLESSIPKGGPGRGTSYHRSGQNPALVSLRKCLNH